MSGSGSLKESRENWALTESGGRFLGPPEAPASRLPIWADPATCSLQIICQPGRFRLGAGHASLWSPLIGRQPSSTSCPTSSSTKCTRCATLRRLEHGVGALGESRWPLPLCLPLCLLWNKDEPLRQSRSPLPDGYSKPSLTNLANLKDAAPKKSESTRSHPTMPSRVNVAALAAWTVPSQ